MGGKLNVTLVNDEESYGGNFAVKVGKTNLLS